MSDEKKDGQQGFKVSDRRKRYDADETAAAPAEPRAPETAPAPAAEPKAAPAAEAHGASTDGGREREHRHEHEHDLDRGEEGPMGPAEFVQLVGKLYEEALVFMGYHDDPQAGRSMANLPVASWHIDILGVLKEKTKGNLTAEETKLVEDAVANLKVLFVRATGLIKH